MRRAFHIGVLAVVLGASAAQAIDVKYLVSARTELRPRTPLPGDVGTTVTGDLELDPTGSLELGIGNGSVLLQYLPTFIWREPQTGGRLLPLQRGRLAYGYRWSRATLLLSEDAAWGLADIGALRPADGSLPDAVNAVQTLGGVPYARSATTAMLDFRVGAFWSFNLTGAYALQGSPEGTANGLPFQKGPTGQALARVRLTRLDALATSAQVSWLTFDTGRDQIVGSLSESWERQLTRTLNVSVGGGVALTRDVVTAADELLMRGIAGTYLDVLPLAVASVSWRDQVLRRPLRLNASTRLSPFSDRFTANVYERLEGRVQGEWLVARDWVATANVSGALAVPVGRTSQAGDRLLGFEAGATWTVKTWLLLQASARVLWTEQPRFSIPGQVQAVGTLSVTVRDQDSLAW